MNLFNRPAFMAINPEFDIILTYLQKIGESLNIAFPEFSPEVGRKVKRDLRKSPVKGGALACVIQDNDSGVREGFTPLMNLG